MRGAKAGADQYVVDLGPGPAIIRLPGQFVPRGMLKHGAS